jgi:hypothetical protein
MSMHDAFDATSDPQVENSLRRAIKLNPSFAPAFDRLAVFLGSRHRNLDEAPMMGLVAVGLDPANVGYRVNVASVLMEMRQGEKAAQVLRNAAKLAKTPEENELITQALLHAEEFSSAHEDTDDDQQDSSDEDKPSEEEPSSASVSVDMPNAPRVVHRDFVPSGPHHFVTGVIQDVHCDASNIDVAVKTSAKTMNLHSDNYSGIQFSAVGLEPNGNLNPCNDLAGKPAKLEYEESADKSQTPRLLSVELRK